MVANQCCRVQIGATVGFYTLLFATRGYDVISIEPSRESVLRILYSLDGNDIKTATHGRDLAPAEGRGAVAFVYQNAAADSYNSFQLRFVADNPGASWIEPEGRDNAVTSGACADRLKRNALPHIVRSSRFLVAVFLDDLLDANTRDPGSTAPGIETAPVIDPKKVRAIKISAEGWDSRVMNGARRMLSLGEVPFVLFVYNKDHVRERGCEADAMIRTLFDYGYRLYYAGIYIYREKELQSFLKGMVQRSSELLFVRQGYDY
jgi:hypothetical protein